MPTPSLNDPFSLALAMAESQDDVILTREARLLGVSDWELKCLRRASELVVPRGALAIEPVRDPFRACARATQLVLPSAVLSHLTAARIHRLEGLPYWAPAEDVHATVDATATRWQRAGVRLHFASLDAEDVTEVDGLRVTSVRRTLIDCAGLLDRTAFVCITDTALRFKSLDELAVDAMRDALRGKRLGRAARWLDLADGRSESPSETQVRLVLHDGGLPPDHLQYEVYTVGGFHVARLDIAWVRKGKKVGMEVESRFHDAKRALYRDRQRLNALRAEEWDVRQVTGYDARRRPGYVLQQARQALQLP